jgi:hypothetical protein
VPKLNPIQLGWIDYSSEHRNKVLAVLHALSAPEAVDELGIGLIRDGFADILFPGTSTIQTRAKYFFIIPYLLMELEKGRHSSPQRMLEKLKEEEIALIQTLNKEGVSGVIGARAGKDLKRRPSSIYWNGLRTFEMFKYDSLSLENYAKALISMQNNKNTALAFGHEELDDADLAHGEYTSTFWRCIIPESDWKNQLSMNLTYEEADYLKDRISKATHSKNSMFAFLLSQDRAVFEAINDFETIGASLSLPDDLREDYLQAMKFSEFISGANIRYNVILSNGENQDAIDKWAEWLSSPFVQSEFQSFQFSAIIDRLKIKNLRLVRFLGEWQKVVVTGAEEEIDRLIIKREIELKSKDRAKLQNSKVYSYNDGNWVGTEKLHYRFRNAKGLIADIFAGLEGNNA